MENTNLRSVARHMIGQMLKETLFPPSRKRWRIFWRSSQMLLRFLLDLARNPDIFWDTMEEAANVRPSDSREDAEDVSELATLKQVLSDVERQIPALVKSELVPPYYEWETRKWIQAAISSDDPHQVYANIRERITRVLEGRTKPLFVPFEIPSPNPEWLACLQANDTITALEKIEGVTFNKIVSNLSNDTALIHLIVSDNGTYAIITGKDAPPEIIMNKSFTRLRIENLLRGWMWLYYWHREHQYQETINRTIKRRKMSAAEGVGFQEATNRIPYRKLFNNQLLFDHLQPTEILVADGKPIIPFPSWLLMEAILRELGKGDLVAGEGLWQRIDEKLHSQGVRQIILCPDKALALFPHHGVILNIGRDGRKECLLDRYEIVYIPQGKFSQVSYGEPQPTYLSLLGTDGDTLSDVGIASLCALAPEYIKEWHANDGREKLASDLSSASALTFLGHGKYDWDDPSQSFLGLLTDSRGNGYNDVITLEDLVAQISPHIDLITLAGCETGLPKITAPVSDYAGFAEDLFLQRGVSTIISTLWPVQQISTILLMRQFHQYWLRGTPATNEKPLSPAKALRKAQLWLRALTREQAIAELETLASVYSSDEIAKEIQALREGIVEQPYGHPYFWSTFYVMGVV